MTRPQENSWTFWTSYVRRVDSPDTEKPSISCADMDCILAFIRSRMEYYMSAYSLAHMTPAARFTANAAPAYVYIRLVRPSTSLGLPETKASVSWFRIPGIWALKYIWMADRTRIAA